MRGWMVGLVVTLAAAGGCDASPKKLPCDSSIAQYCGLHGNCVLTWDQAQSDTVFCAAARHADCGNYHVVNVLSLDTSTNFYYDVSSGQLVAIVAVSPPTPGSTCAAGPAGGFTLPTCTGLISELLPQCLDGGVD